MSLLFENGFDNYGVTTVTPLARQPWWRRLLRLKRPAGRAYVHFHFQISGGKWSTMEATADYPKGMDAIKLTLNCRFDGNTIVIADMPKQEGSS